LSDGQTVKHPTRDTGQVDWWSNSRPATQVRLSDGQTVKHPTRDTGQVVEHPTRYTGQVREERVTVDEVHGVTIWIAVERRTSVTHRCRTPVAVITRRWWTRATELCCRQSLTLTAIN